MRDCNAQTEGFVLGLDLGDRRSHYAVMDQRGQVVEESSVPTTQKWMKSLFDNVPVGRVVMEVGTHSPWVSRMAEEKGHEVGVANARRLRLIYENNQKCDRVDAEMLARLGRVDAKLLYPVKHRSRQQQADLGLLKSREAMVKARTQLINHTRGIIKAWGLRLVKCSAGSFHRRVRESIPAELQAALAAISHRRET